MLDRNKPYATVYGGGVLAFMQGDRLFDSQGFELDADLQRVGQPKPVPEAEPIVTPVEPAPEPEATESKQADEAPRTRLRIKR